MPARYNPASSEIRQLSFNGSAMPGRSENRPPGESGIMKSKGLRSLSGSEGKGFFGCVVSLVLFGIAVYLAIALGPHYYANFNFEAEVKTIVSRAATHAFTDEGIIKDVMDMAKRNEIKLEREDIKIDRFAGQLHIKVNYSVPVDFVIFERDINFRIDASSYIGAL
jgi:hypothetical protein